MRAFLAQVPGRFSRLNDTSGKRNFYARPIGAHPPRKAEAVHPLIQFNRAKDNSYVDFRRCAEQGDRFRTRCRLDT